MPKTAKVKAKYTWYSTFSWGNFETEVLKYGTVVYGSYSFTCYQWCIAKHGGGYMQKGVAYVCTVYPAYLWSLRRVYAVKKTRRLVYGVYPRILPNTPLPVTYTFIQPVCVSVMLTYCAQTTESIIMRPSPDCSPGILVFPYRLWTR